MESRKSKEQFLQLYRACEGDLFRYILVLLPEYADAMDILQETATDLWRDFERYDETKPFEGWARRFAHFTLVG